MSKATGDRRAGVASGGGGAPYGPVRAPAEGHGAGEPGARTAGRAGVRTIDGRDDELRVGGDERSIAETTDEQWHQQLPVGEVRRIGRRENDPHPRQADRDE